MKPFHTFISTILSISIIIDVKSIGAQSTIGHELLERLIQSGRNQTTFFKEVQVRQYNDYGSLEIFQFTVPPGSVYLRWYLLGAETNLTCPARKIISHLQYGGFPIFTPDGQDPNKTFPDNVYHDREYQSTATVLSDQRHVKEINIPYPMPGDWFLASYVSENIDQVIKKITSSKCRYGLGVRATVTVPELQITEDISFANAFTVHMNADDDTRLYRFSVADNLWKYHVVVRDCKEDGVAKKCPLVILTRGGSYPSPLMPGSHRVHCNQLTEDSCTLSVQSPLLNHWHYMIISKEGSKNLTFKLELDSSDCIPPRYVEITVKPKQNKKPLALSKESSNSTTLKFHPSHDISGKGETGDGSETEAEKDQNHTKDAENSKESDASESKQSSSKNTAGDGNSTHIPLIPNHWSELESDHCPEIYHFQRLESAKSDYYTYYTVDGRSGVARFGLCDSSVGIISFDVLPLKDIGGALVFSTELKTMNNSSLHNTTVEACIQQGSLPLDSSQMLCSDTATRFNLSTFNRDGNVSADLYFPYPQPGRWFVAMRARCFGSDSRVSKPCYCPEALVTLQLMIAPCMSGECGRYGRCQAHNMGAYSLSACSCVAGYQGFACTDGTNATSDQIQLTYTLLLTLSNMFFWPAIGLATYRRYYVEAVVYFANMFFSTMYHACDVAGMSIFRECIMPYNVLQYCDFFLSIMSFWVTLLAVARIPAPLRSVAHMVGVIGLAMGVEWQEHGLWPYIVPISTGAAIAIISWVVHCFRTKQCCRHKRHILCLIPGFLIAALGLCIFAFIETDKNYAFTHSGWHFCMSICIIFLLPKRKQKIIDETASESSLYELGHTETVSLVPADAEAINAADGYDLNL